MQDHQISKLKTKNKYIKFLLSGQCIQVSNRPGVHRPYVLHQCPHNATMSNNVGI